MHGWRLPPGKIYLPFKTMKNTKIADLFLSMNSSYDLDDLLPKKLKYYRERKIWRHFSPAAMAGYPKLNGFFSVFRYFFITWCSDRRLITIEFKELLYLMPFFVFFLL